MGSFLDWAALVLPTLLSIVGVYVSIESPKLETNRAKWACGLGLVAFGILISVLTYQQQKYARDKASAQIEMNYIPSVALTYQDKRLYLFNKGKSNLYFWGVRLNNEAIEKEPRIIPPDAHYYIFADAFEKAVLRHTSENREVRIPLEIYISNELGKKFVGKFQLLLIAKDGSLAVHTQMVGLDQHEW